MSNDDVAYKICIHYAGHVRRDASRYVGGETCDLGVYDIDKLCYFDITDKLKEIGIQSLKVMYYRVPNLPFASGLLPLTGDVEIIEVAKILMELGICHVYVENDSANVEGEKGAKSFCREPYLYEVNVAASEGSSKMQASHSKMALFQHDMLGSDTDDEELVAGIEKMNERYVDFENQNHAANKPIDKGKQKVMELSKGKRKLNSFSNLEIVNQASKGITIRDVEDEDRFVANSDVENSDSNCSERDSEYIDSSDLGNYYSDSSIEIEDLFMKDEALRTASSNLHYNPNCEVPHFEVGMIFENAIQFKEAIAKYSLHKGCNLHWKKNEPARQRYACDVKHGCPWEIYAGYDNADNCFKIKTYHRKHACFKTNKNRLVTRQFLVTSLRTLATNALHLTSRQLAKHVKSEIGVDVSRYKCQRAKKIIKDEFHGSYIEQYKLLRGYGEHMVFTNLGSTCAIGTQNSPQIMYQFKRIYMCFDGCKKGWKAGCRAIIGVDGSFLKGPCKVILLSVIGRDGNNQMFNLAWAVVDIENKDNWQWFMELLNNDIELVKEWV